MNISLSIIIPCYNSGLFLDECIKSILKYYINNVIEIVIVDDGSYDIATVNILNFYSKKHGIIVEKLTRNYGVQYARNVGISKSKGEFLMMLDSDDKLMDSIDGKSYIGEAIEVLRNNRNIAFVHCYSEMFGDYTGMTISSYPLNEELIISKHHVPISIIYRKSDVLTYENYLVRIKKWQDWSFGVKLLSNRWKRQLPNQIYTINKAHHRYRVHNEWTRISYSKKPEKLMTEIVVEDCLDYFINFYGIKSSARIAEIVVSLKPNKIDELCYIANHNIELARRVISERKLKIESSSLDEQIP